MRKMGRAEIVSHGTRDQLSIMNDMTVPIHFFEGLTQKQMKFLVLAYENGLFELPARIDLETLAKQVRVARSTYGEHLRKAELQILRNSYPLLKLRSLEHAP